VFFDTQTQRVLVSISWTHSPDIASDRSRRIASGSQEQRRYRQGIYADILGSAECRLRGTQALDCQSANAEALMLRLCTHFPGFPLPLPFAEPFPWDSLRKLARKDSEVISLAFRRLRRHISRTSEMSRCCRN